MNKYPTQANTVVSDMVTRQSQMNEVGHNLDKSVEELYQRLQELKNRLTPVMRDEPANKQETPRSPEPTLVPMADKFRDVQHKVVNCIELVEYINEKLEV
jgi:uncharacterized protein YPO0396